MSSAVVRLQHPRASAATPAWVALPIVVFGAAMAVATWIGGQWPLTLLVLLFVGASFVVVLNRPHIGISLFLTTFLINYPGVARGVGPLTINNLLGIMFLALLAWNYYTTRDTWYLREPLLWMLMAIGAVLVLAVAYIALLAWGMSLAAHAFAGGVAPLVSPPIAAVMAVNAGLLCWRLTMRVAFTGAAYGWREACWAVPRALVGNFIALLAARRAVTRYIAMLRGGSAEWEKTRHSFPTDISAAVAR